jgi:hypothetical protein
MGPRVILLAVIFGLASGWPASAQERTLAGEISVLPLQVDVRGNRAKFNEYRDLRDGAPGNIGLRHEAGKDYLDLRAGDIGRRDQRYELEGGSWGTFTFHLGYDEIPHNFSPGR